MPATHTVIRRLYYNTKCFNTKFNTYKVLLGQPFDIITESLVKNGKDGGQTLMLTDPNTGEQCVMHTYERGKVPEILKRAVKQDFWEALMKHC